MIKNIKKTIALIFIWLIIIPLSYIIYICYNFYKTFADIDEFVQFSYDYVMPWFEKLIKIFRRK